MEEPILQKEIHFAFKLTQAILGQSRQYQGWEIDHISFTPSDSKFQIKFVNPLCEPVTLQIPSELLTDIKSGDKHSWDVIQNAMRCHLRRNTPLEITNRFGLRKRKHRHYHRRYVRRPKAKKEDALALLLKED